MDDIFGMMDGMMGSGGGFWLEPDFLLSTLVSLTANQMNSQLGVTLVVKGTIMTGVLAGEREYLSAMNNVFKALARDAMPSPSEQDLKLIDEMFSFDALTEDQYPTEMDGDEEDEDDEDDELEYEPIRHLHLKDPVIIYPNAALSFLESPLPILRIKLSTVDGWMLGRMSLISGDDMDDMPGMSLDNGIRH